MLLVLLLGAVTSLSQFYRVSNSVIGPEVAAELGLSARDLGCSASFMSAVYLCSRWFGVHRFTLILSWVFAISNIGTLFAATPLAWASQTIGWRHAFDVLAGSPLWLTVALLMVIPFLSSYSIVIVAQGRSLFPDRLAGRGVTTVNMAQVVGATVLPALTGYIVGAFVKTPAAAAPESAYRAVFATLAVGSLLGLLVYLRSADSRPRVWPNS